MPHDMEAVDHPCRFRGHDLEHGVVGPRHVETAELEVVFDVVGTSFEPAGHLCELPCGKDLDELVVHDIADRGRPALVLVGTKADKQCLVESHCRRLFEALGVGLQQGSSIDAHRGVDDVPGTAELPGEMGDALSCADLFHEPLGRPGRHHAALGGDAVVRQGERALPAVLVRASEAVLFPA